MFNKILVWPNFPGKIDGNLETTNQKYETKPNINEKGSERLLQFIRVCVCVCVSWRWPFVIFFS